VIFLQLYSCSILLKSYFRINLQFFIFRLQNLEHLHILQKKSLDVLRELFPSHVISLRGDVGWSARSPNASSAIISFEDVSKLKSPIGQQQYYWRSKRGNSANCGTISEEMTSRVMENFKNRLQQCVDCRVSRAPPRGCDF